MKKQKLRIKYKNLRANFTVKQIEGESIKIANNLLNLPIWEYSYYHLFLSIVEKKEVDTTPILHVLNGKDKNVVVSKSDFSTFKLHNYLLTDSTTLKVNSWGIPEPVDGIEIEPNKIEVVFIPLLAFDETGHRIGYGKGFYDRFLKECKPEALKIGLSFFEAENKLPGILATDVPLDFCVTPEKIYRFKNYDK